MSVTSDLCTELTAAVDGCGTSVGGAPEAIVDASESVLRLKHRGHALLLACEVEDDRSNDLERRFRSQHRDPWTWPLVLDAGAQAAGLLVKDLDRGFTGTLVVVAYDELQLELEPRAGTLLVRVSKIRRVLGMTQVGVVATDAATHEIRMRATVSLAPMPPLDQHR